MKSIRFIITFIFTFLLIVDSNHLKGNEVAYTLKWQYDLDKKLIYVSNFSFIDNEVFFGSHEGLIFGLSLSSGNKKWEYQGKERYPAMNPILKNEVIYFNSNNTLYAVNRKTKQIYWEYYKHKYGFISSPTISGNSLFIGCKKGYVLSLYLKTGKINWITNLNSLVGVSKPVVDNESVYVSTNNGIYALDTKSGKILWKSQLWKDKINPYDIEEPLILSDSIITWNKNYIYSIEKKDGKLKWSYNLPSAKYRNWDIHSMKIHSDSIIFAKRRYLYSVDKQKKDINWKFRAKGLITGVLITKKLILFGTSRSESNRGYLYALNISTGKEIWKYKAKSTEVTQSLAIKNNTIVFSSRGDATTSPVTTVYALEIH
ncbi:MAG: PQQ-binding-like beta-propeller repeat protein [Deltaproteobacteria bacterium]|nr:PQQ-binding-like beta-propeller repeat protein [Deltaproteobacteria bacterium]